LECSFLIVQLTLTEEPFWGLFIWIYHTPLNPFSTLFAWS